MAEGVFKDLEKFRMGLFYGPIVKEYECFSHNSLLYQISMGQLDDEKEAHKKNHLNELFLIS